MSTQDDATRDQILQACQQPLTLRQIGHALGFAAATPRISVLVQTMVQEGQLTASTEQRGGEFPNSTHTFARKVYQAVTK